MIAKKKRKQKAKKKERVCSSAPYHRKEFSDTEILSSEFDKLRADSFGFSESDFNDSQDLESAIQSVQKETASIELNEINADSEIGSFEQADTNLPCDGDIPKVASDEPIAADEIVIEDSLNVSRDSYSSYSGLEDSESYELEPKEASAPVLDDTCLNEEQIKSTGNETAKYGSLSCHTVENIFSTMRMGDSPGNRKTQVDVDLNTLPALPAYSNFELDQVSKKEVQFKARRKQLVKHPTSIYRLLEEYVYHEYNVCRINCKAIVLDAEVKSEVKQGSYPKS